MDWRKTKTILIFTLLFINIVLIGVLAQGSIQEFVEKNSRLESVLSIYDQKDIALSSGVLKQPSQVPKVYLTYEQVDHQKLEKYLMKEESTFNSEESMYESENFRLQVLPDSIIFSPVGTFDLAPSKTTLTPDEIAEFLILEMGYSKDYELVKRETSDNRTVLEYTQVIDQYYLEDTFMKFVIENGNIMRFERKWFSSLEYRDESVDIVPIDRMLFQLLVSLGEEDKFIENIEIVYRLESTMSNVLLSGEATPYFRITMDSGMEYYEHATEKFYNP